MVIEVVLSKFEQIMLLLLLPDGLLLVDFLYLLELPPDPEESPLLPLRLGYVLNGLRSRGPGHPLGRQPRHVTRAGTRGLRHGRWRCGLPPSVSQGSTLVNIFLGFEISEAVLRVLICVIGRRNHGRGHGGRRRGWNRVKGSVLRGRRTVTRASNRLRPGFNGLINRLLGFVL